MPGDPYPRRPSAGLLGTHQVRWKQKGQTYLTWEPVWPSEPEYQGEPAGNTTQQSSSWAARCGEKIMALWPGAKNDCDHSA